MKKLLSIIILPFLLNSCGNVGIGVGVAVDGDTISEGASWFGENILFILLFVILFIGVVCVGASMESRKHEAKMKEFWDKREEEKLKAIEQRKKIEKESQERIDIRTKSLELAQTFSQSNSDTLEYQSVKIENVKNKVLEIKNRYTKDDKPAGMSMMMYFSLYCKKNPDVFFWLFDDESLNNKKEEELDIIHKLMISTFEKLLHN